MDEKTAVSLIADNAITGTAGAAAVAILYKVWRILKSDRKVDDLDNNERSFRDELRKEIAELKADKIRLEEMNQKLLFELSELKSVFTFCQRHHNSICPVFRRERENNNENTG